MFEKLVVSCSDRQKPRVTKFLVGTILGYLTCIVAAMIVSIVTTNPGLAGLGSPNIRLTPAAMPIADHAVSPTSRPSGPQRNSGPAEFSNPNQAFNPNLAPREGPTLPLGPPNISDLVDRSPGLGPGGDPGGLGQGPGELSLSSAVVPPPPPRPERQPVGKKVDSKTTLRVSQRVLEGKAITRVSPPYPPLAKMARLGGSVVVEIIISPEGVVESARAVSGHPMFVTAAVEAARGWRFQPTLLGDVPVRVTGLITFVFSLN
jgi:periplasmic protein TonB